MPNILRALRIKEVSSVDRGAGEGVKVMLTKREFSDEDRKRLAASGAALPDGSFPIETVEDLENAVHAYGRSNDKPAAKAHIMTRARSLGAEDRIPANWKAKRSFGARLKTALGIGKLDFSEAQAGHEAGEFGSDMVAEFREALESLQISICSIMADDAVTDKDAAIKQSIAQFQEHIQKVVPEGYEQAMQAAALLAAGFRIDAQGALTKGDQTMTDQEKAEMEAKDKARKEAEEKAEHERKEHEKTKKSLSIAQAVLKLSEKHRAYISSSDMSDAEKEKFIDKTPAERDAHMERDTNGKGADDDDDEVKKELAKRDNEIAALRKSVADMQAQTELVNLQKRATDIGLPIADAAIIQKAYAGDRAAVDHLLDRIAKLYAAEKASDVLKEFGSRGRTTGGTATEAMKAEAENLMKADKTITTLDAAIAKIADSPLPSHRALWKSYREEDKAA
jgi:hypothetical protein